MLACSKTNISEPVIHALQFFPWPFHPPLPEQNVVFWKVTCIRVHISVVTKCVTKFLTLSKTPHCDSVKNFVTHFVTPEIWTLTLYGPKCQTCDRMSLLVDTINLNHLYNWGSMTKTFPTRLQYLVRITLKWSIILLNLMQIQPLQTPW